VAVFPQIAREVARIRADIERAGESHVGPRQLSVLRPEISTAERLRRVAEIARWEHWSFEFLTSDQVRFRPRLSTDEIGHED
jgi:hypothetical protein